ncbi:N-acetylneuraminate synthase family protein [Candidatus Nitronereus thalassa]|uniref:N-acetylneuraminate synthase family protein n=1 Tax=Candidatus Nitronereus thalassa TaxID=3020898 RepID=A0ABU3K5C8_9BACT|nr:N-acetylneuraminate synthase family protein [Candidatus Nitronereus thalassa]MDT7041574.1 N-acetylneuraminate synthase family protein [Candidatus Nitronereus thalassa]
MKPQEHTLGATLTKGNAPCFVIAEIAQAHDGSLGTAHAYIDAVAKAGVDAVKFQTHLAEFESTPDEPWRVKFSRQDASRFEYWKRMEFTEVQWKGLKDHAQELGLKFLSSPFSLEAVELLTRVGVSGWKVPSGETNNLVLLERIVETKLPIILSTGMSSIEEIDKAVKYVQPHHVPLAILQCTSSYPCPPEKLGLNLIAWLRERYGCAVGLSDHSGTVYAGLAAAALGSQVVEVHVTFSREMFGPDVPVSITTSELKQLVDGVRFIEQALHHPLNKDEIFHEMQTVRNLFTKSIVVRKSLPVGAVLTPEFLAVKKPGTGIPASHLREVTGRKLKRPVLANTFLSNEDLL